MAHTDWKTVPVQVEILEGDRWLARTADGELCGTGATTPEPTVEDLELARWLGYERPHEIRRLITRLKGRGRLTREEVFVTVTKTSSQGGRPGRAYRLTRTACFLVATQSETPRAWQLTRLLVAVFEAVLDKARGGLDLTALVAELRAQRGQLEAQSAEIAALRDRVAEPASVYLVPAFRAAQLKARLASVAACLARILTHKTQHAHRTAAETEMRAHVGYPRAREYRLEHMPFDMWERAMLVTGSRLATLQLALRAMGEKQLELATAPAAEVAP